MLRILSVAMFFLGSSLAGQPSVTLKLPNDFPLSIEITPSGLGDGIFTAKITNNYEEPLIAVEIFEFRAPESENPETFMEAGYSVQRIFFWGGFESGTTQERFLTLDGEDTQNPAWHFVWRVAGALWEDGRHAGIRENLSAEIRSEIQKVLTQSPEGEHLEYWRQLLARIEQQDDAYEHRKAFGLPEPPLGP